MSGQVNATAIGTFPASAALGPYLRVKRDSASGLVVAGPLDVELGTLNDRHLITGLGSSSQASVVYANAPGTVFMVAAAAITQYATVYGAEGGKVSSVENTNPIGMALQSASGNNSQIEVLRMPVLASAGTGGAIDGGVLLDDDFLGDYPAAATAINYGWTKVETNGLGVTSSGEADGVLKFAFDAVVEAATAALYIAALPFDIDQNPIWEARMAVFDKGDDTSLDFNIGLASGTHATDFDSVSEYIAFHIDGNTLDIKAQSKDGATTVAAIDTTVDAVDDTYLNLKIDMTDVSDCKLYINDTRVLSSTTFDMSNYSGRLTPIVHLEKTSNDTTADFRVDRIRVSGERSNAA